MTTQTVVTGKGESIEFPPFITALLTDRRAALIWLPIRIWLGIQWLQAGYGKLTPAWMQTGAALKGFLGNALANSAGEHPAMAYGWYQAFVSALIDSGAYVWFAKLVVVGELAVGLGLVLGTFTGLAAFGGALMNWNYMMAGSAGVNPMFFLIEIALIAAWKVAGYIGGDYFVFRFGATPWKGRPAEAK